MAHPRYSDKYQYPKIHSWNDLVLDLLSGTPATNNTPALDAFGRRRMSQPYTLFDSKLLGDNRALFWSDAEASGGGTGTAYDINTATTTLSVGAETAGARVRQTFQPFNYQPGKSQLVNMTFVMGAAATGITRRVGYFGTSDGLFLEQTSDGVRFVIRTSATGSPVDNKYEQSDWNLDILDGTGVSGVTLDLSKAQILYIDFESLQVGSVRFGFVIDGVIRYAHVQHHANTITGVYFRSPNQRPRYEISNDGTGAASTLKCICTTVISEGGQQVTGITRGESTKGTHLSASAADTLYALIGIRLKSTHLDNIVKLVKLTVIAETNDDFEWEILLNPTVAGSFTYSDVSNSAVQTAKGATANTVTLGTLLDCGFEKSRSSSVAVADTLRYLGSAVDGTRDTIVLCVRPLANNAVIQGTLIWREFA